MESPFANPAEAALILNQLSESTRDYYFYYSFSDHLFYLSQNFETADDLFAISKTVCTLISTGCSTGGANTASKSRWTISAPAIPASAG